MHVGLYSQTSASKATQVQVLVGTRDPPLVLEVSYPQALIWLLEFLQSQTQSQSRSQSPPPSSSSPSPLGSTSELLPVHHLFVADGFAFNCLIRYLDIWHQTGYQTSRNQPVAHAREWEQVYQLLKSTSSLFHIRFHNVSPRQISTHWFFANRIH